MRIPIVSKNLRTVKFWVRYRPKSREVVQIQKYKHELGEPSKASGDVIVECKGFYTVRS